jgi:malonyl-CoA/methylmalonyl-CoA synthetase
MPLETLTKGIDDAVMRWPDHEALTFLRDGQMETVLSYAQLGWEIAAFAGILSQMGVGKGVRVIMFLNKSIDAVIAHLALQKLGAVAIPLNPDFKASEMRYLLDDARSDLVLCDAGRGSWIVEIDPDARILELPTHRPYALRATDEAALMTDFPDCDIQDPALIIYTSGTTGSPKGAVLTQQNLVYDAANVIAIWEITQTDVLCHSLPLFHVHGLCFALHTLLLSGGHAVLLNAFQPDRVLDVLSSRGGSLTGNIFMAVPAMYTKLMERLESGFKAAGSDFAHIRLLTSGSAPLPARDFKRIEALFGQPPVEREGMSETGMNFSNPLHGRRVPGSVGKALPGLEVRIVNPDTFQDLSDSAMADGAVGEIWLKGPAITPGYWQKPQETSDAFESGWFRTGDLGRRDENGYYYLTDRIKHIIITGGENVSAKEVESVINRLEGVAESSVVGVPDDKWGERVVAAIILKPGALLNPQSVKDHCKIHLHDWKCPKQVVFLQQLPRNTMGKVLKEEIKRRLLEMTD